MEQLEYWQAIEDGAEVEEEPKKKKKNKKKLKNMKNSQPMIFLKKLKKKLLR